MTENVGIALLLATIAGLSTGIGSAIAYFIRKPKAIYLSFSMGLASGVMLYVSFVELLPQASESIGVTWGTVAFFAGIFLTSLLDALIPEADNPHHYTESKGIVVGEKNPHLFRTGLFTALAIGVHNFPEGLAAFGVALSSVELGVIVTIAIAIHNIPEGISVSIPIYYATGSKNKAFWYSFASGLAEPIGAFIGYLILRPFLSPELISFLLAGIAGIMVYISLDEILPTAHRYGHGHAVISGAVLGMLIMALSLLLL